MITKIREGLYLGDSTAQLEVVEPVCIIDLTGWHFDMIPMKNERQKREIHKILHIMTVAMNNGTPVLVRCHGGMDRSPFIVACFLHVYYIHPNMYNGVKTYDEVKRLHPATIIHDDWMRWWLQG